MPTRKRDVAVSAGKAVGTVALVAAIPVATNLVGLTSIPHVPFNWESSPDKYTESNEFVHGRVGELRAALQQAAEQSTPALRLEYGKSAASQYESALYLGTVEKFSDQSSDTYISYVDAGENIQTIANFCIEQNIDPNQLFEVSPGSATNKGTTALSAALVQLKVAQFAPTEGQPTPDVVKTAQQNWPRNLATAGRQGVGAGQGSFTALSNTLNIIDVAGDQDQSPYNQGIAVYLTGLGKNPGLSLASVQAVYQDLLTADEDASSHPTASCMTKAQRSLRQIGTDDAKELAGHLRRYQQKVAKYNNGTAWDDPGSFDTYMEGIGAGWTSGPPADKFDPNNLSGGVEKLSDLIKDHPPLLKGPASPNFQTLGSMADACGTPS